MLGKGGIDCGEGGGGGGVEERDEKDVEVEGMGVPEVGFLGSCS